MDYNEVNEKLQGRCFWSRKVGNNTYLLRLDDNIAMTHLLSLRLHYTNVLTWMPDGRVIIESGGWRTLTTKDRINRFIPYGYIFQERRIWYFGYRDNDGVEHTRFYADGMVLNPDRTVDGSLEVSSHNQRVLGEYRDKLYKYAKHYAKNVVFPIGATTVSRDFNEEELRSLVDDSSLDQSLILRAIELFPVSPECMWLIYGVNEVRDFCVLQGQVEGQIKDSVYRYLLRRQGFAA